VVPGRSQPFVDDAAEVGQGADTVRPDELPADSSDPEGWHNGSSVVASDPVESLPVKWTVISLWIPPEDSP
jgi:hypothetical protein